MKFILALFLCLMPNLALASLANNGFNVLYSSGTTNLSAITGNTISIGGWFDFKGIGYTASRVFEFETETGSDDQLFNVGLQDCSLFGGTVNTVCISLGMDNSALNTYGAAYVSTSLPITGKHHIIITWNNTTGNVANDFKFYVDGSLTGTAINSFTGTAYSTAFVLTSERSATSIFLGAGTDGFVTHDYYPGTMSDVAVWNKALTSGEVTTLYNAGVPSPCSHIPASIEASSLIAYFPLDDHPSGIINTNPNEYAGNYSFAINTNQGNVTWSNDMSCPYTIIKNLLTGHTQVAGMSAER